MAVPLCPSLAEPCAGPCCLAGCLARGSHSLFCGDVGGVRECTKERFKLTLAVSFFVAFNAYVTADTKDPYCLFLGLFLVPCLDGGAGGGVL